MRVRPFSFAGIVSAVVPLLLAASILPAQSSKPRVFLVSPEALMKAKQQHPPALMRQAVADANHAMKTLPLSVVSNRKTPPSGDKHDYMSMARYWWPNPDTKDHLPYVRHDGRVNPEINTITDHAVLQKMSESVRSLALAWYLTGDEQFARHASSLLRTFFLDPTTAMKPNLNYAQYIPGRNLGRGAGVLDARSLPMVIDAMGMLANSKSWTPADQAGMKRWYTAYSSWLATSANGLHEKAAKNNHGSWYAVQAADIDMFLGRTDAARAIAEQVRTQRIPSQFDAQGLQKYELVRTNSFSYSAFNLEALTELANIVSSTGIDLYKPVQPGAPGILTGIDALMPYDAAHPWPHQQINPSLLDSLCPALVRAAVHTHDPRYVEAQKRFNCQPTVVRMIEELGETK